MKKYILLLNFCTCLGLSITAPDSFGVSEKKRTERLAVQIIGAPGSGKSMALNDILGYLPSHLRHVVSSQSGNSHTINKSNVNKMDIDVFREQTEKLPGREQFFLFVQAIKTFSRIKTKFGGWLDWCTEGLMSEVKEEGQLHKKIKESFGILLQIKEDNEEGESFLEYKKEGEAMWNKVTIDKFGDFITALKDGLGIKKPNADLDAELKGIFDNMKGICNVRNVFARLEFLKLFYESVAAGKNVVFDNIGNNFDDIISALTQARKMGFLTLLYAIVHKDCSVNMFLNSFRVIINNAQYAPPDMILSSFTKIKKLTETNGESSYVGRAESICTIETNFLKEEVQKQLCQMDTRDNFSRKAEGKAFDLLIVDSRKSLSDVLEFLNKVGDEQRKQIFALTRASVALAYLKNEKQQNPPNSSKEEFTELKKCIESIESIGQGLGDWSSWNEDKEIIGGLLVKSHYIKDVWGEVIQNDDGEIGKAYASIKKLNGEILQEKTLPQ